MKTEVSSVRGIKWQQWMRLAQMGDIAEIINYADRLERADSKLIVFTTQIRQLAKGFKLKQLLKFIQQS